MYELDEDGNRIRDQNLSLIHIYFEQIYIIACGSAWHVGMAAQYVLESMADVPVRVELDVYKRQVLQYYPIGYMRIKIAFYKRIKE